MPPPIERQNFRWLSDLRDIKLKRAETAFASYLRNVLGAAEVFWETGRQLLTQWACGKPSRKRMRRTFVFGLLVVGFVTSALAQRVDLGQNGLLQFLLIWSGDYNGMVDGVRGPLTEAALHRFAQRNSLTNEPYDRLVEEASIAMVDAGFTLHRSAILDVTFGVPERLVGPVPSRDAHRLIFRSPDNEAELEVAYIQDRYRSLDELYRKLSNLRGRIVTYATLRSGWFVINGYDAGKRFYVRYHGNGPRIWGFAISYPEARAAEFEPSVVAMSNLFRLGATASDPLISFVEGLQTAIRNEPPSSPPQAPSPSAARVSSGSGFILSSEGTILTNAHVVQGCANLEVSEFGPAKLLAMDEDRDLAIITISETPTSFAIIQANPPELGQEVVILGYPLSDLMGNALSVTTGVISSLSGLGGDKDSYTLTANIQPGNSGGPILNRNGEVVGVAVAKLNEITMLRETGVSGANIGFAIGSRPLLEFLKPFKSASTDRRADQDLTVQAITAKAKEYTVQIFCKGGT